MPTTVTPLALAALLLLPAPPSARAQSTDDAEIRRRRESSNAAIARHDTAGIGAILAPHFAITTSLSVHEDGRALHLTTFAELFRDRPDVVYRRTPADIRVFAPWGMAAEYGTWTGSWTDTDGTIQIRGTYFAKWRKLGGAWLVESETYVPEACVGGSYCGARGEEGGGGGSSCNGREEFSRFSGADSPLPPPRSFLPLTA